MNFLPFKCLPERTPWCVMTPFFHYSLDIREVIIPRSLLNPIYASQYGYTPLLKLLRTRGAHSQTVEPYICLWIILVPVHYLYNYDMSWPIEVPSACFVLEEDFIHCPITLQVCALEGSPDRRNTHALLSAFIISCVNIVDYFEVITLSEYFYQPVISPGYFWKSTLPLAFNKTISLRVPTWCSAERAYWNIHLSGATFKITSPAFRRLSIAERLSGNISHFGAILTKTYHQGMDN